MKLKFIRLKTRSPLEIVNSLFEFTYKNYDLRNVKEEKFGSPLWKWKSFILSTENM